MTVPRAQYDELKAILDQHKAQLQSILPWVHRMEKIAPLVKQLAENGPTFAPGQDIPDDIIAFLGGYRVAMLDFCKAFEGDLSGLENQLQAERVAVTQDAESLLWPTN